MTSAVKLGTSPVKTVSSLSRSCAATAWFWGQLSSAMYSEKLWSSMRKAVLARHLGNQGH